MQTKHTTEQARSFIMADEINYDHHQDGIDRRGFLKCMGWVGTGIVYAVSGGVLRSEILGSDKPPGAAAGDFTFVQISDSHIGFNKPPNKDVTATFQEAVNRINAMPHPPEVIIH